MERVLLHTCCAPCSLSCIDPLRSEGIEPVAFWYNPNIHPWKEYQARRDCLLAYAPTIGMKVRVQEDYGLKDFVRHVAGDIDTHGTGEYADAGLARAVCAVFDLTPDGMIRALGLDRPGFAQFCNYGNFTHQEAPWEQTDRGAELRQGCASIAKK